MSRNKTAILAIIMLLTLVVLPASADTIQGGGSTLQNATDLHNMGLYAGSSSTEFVPDLGSALTREQGIALLIRLMGLESDAQAMTDAEVTSSLSAFSDRSEVSDWARRYVGYAVRNNILAGFPDRSLHPRGQLTGNQYATMLLHGAGYTVTGGTFSQATQHFAQMAGIGSASFRSMGSLPILRSHAVDMSFGALGMPLGGRSLTLIQQLVEQGIVTPGQALQGCFQIGTDLSTTSSSSLVVQTPGT